MTNLLNTVAIQRTVRALEQYDSPNAARIEVGRFTVDGESYGIRLQKYYYNTDHGNEKYTISLEVQYPSLSGLVYVGVGEFSAVHPDSYTGHIPQIHIDRNWLTWHSAPAQNMLSVSISVVPVGKGVHKKCFFTVEGDELNDMLDDFESQQFQHNLVCDDTTVVDEEYNLSCLSLVFSEFELMYNAKSEITCIDLMPNYILSPMGDGKFMLPYEQIATEIENYVKTKSE